MVIKIKDVELHLLKFWMITDKKYLAILHTGYKMVIIKNKECIVTFIKVHYNFLYLKDILFVFIIYLIW